MRKLTLALCLATLLGQLAAATTIVEYNDLDDNQVPAGWELDTLYAGPGIVDRRLWAMPVDGRSYLSKALDPQASEVVMEWDANIVNNYWGGANSIYVYDAAGHVFNLGNWYSSRQSGSDHYFYGGWCQQVVEPNDYMHLLGAEIDCENRFTTLYMTTIPVEFTEYHFTATLVAGAMRLQAQRLSDGAIAFDMTVSVPELGASPIVRVQHFVQVNESNGCWVDNLRLAYRIPTPTLGCLGFEDPIGDAPVEVRGNRALPFKAVLTGPDGAPWGDADLVAAPVIQVLYQPGDGGEPVDVTDFAVPVGEGTEGNQFEFTDDGRWQYNLKVRSFTASGLYEVSLVSGDDSEYEVDPTCVGGFVIR